jgi:hypothetical protein
MGGWEGGKIAINFEGFVTCFHCLTITKTDLYTVVTAITQHACHAAALCNRTRPTKAIALCILATATKVGFYSA